MPGPCGTGAAAWRISTSTSPIHRTPSRAPESSAAALDNHSLPPFLDEWAIQPGDIIINKLEEGLASCGAAVLVFSEETSAPRFHEEYAALMQRIPVLATETAQLPAFADGRRAIDFSRMGGSTGPEPRSAVVDLRQGDR